jgi:hypothetical protein
MACLKFLRRPIVKCEERQEIVASSWIFQVIFNCCGLMEGYIETGFWRNIFRIFITTID